MLMIAPASVAEFLQSNFDSDISEVVLIGSGMFSQAFSFNLNQQEFVIRLNSFLEDFQKDAFAYQQFASARLPIPKVIRCDRFNDTHYFAITERCAGSTLKDLDEGAIRKTLPSLFNTLHNIHTLDTSNYSGWGLTDASGNGRFACWQDYLNSFYNQKFSFTWEQLFRHTFMEPELYQIVTAVIQNDSPLCSTAKHWVHGDFGFDNIMSDGQKVTGVLDWAESRLGDYVYDIAYLEFWSKGIPYKQLWLESVEAQQLSLSLTNFEARMQCYMLHIGLGSLAIAALQNDMEDYTQVKARIQKILDEG